MLICIEVGTANFINVFKEIQMSKKQSQRAAEARYMITGLTLVAIAIFAIVVWGPAVVSIFPLPMN